MVRSTTRGVYVKPDSVLARTAREMLEAHFGGWGPRDGVTACPTCGDSLPCAAGRAAAEVLTAAGLAQASQASGLVQATRQALPTAPATPHPSGAPESGPPAFGQAPEKMSAFGPVQREQRQVGQPFDRPVAGRPPVDQPSTPDRSPDGQPPAGGRDRISAARPADGPRLDRSDVPRPPADREDVPPPVFKGWAQFTQEAVAPGAVDQHPQPPAGRGGYGGATDQPGVPRSTPDTYGQPGGPGHSQYGLTPAGRIPSWTPGGGNPADGTDEPPSGLPRCPDDDRLPPAPGANPAA